MDYRFRNTFMDQDFAVVLLFADKPDAEFLQVSSRILRSAHPYFGRLPHLEESRGLFGAVRHASAQNYNCVGRSECILPHKPPAGTAHSNHHGQGQNQSN